MTRLLPLIGVVLAGCAPVLSRNVIGEPIFDKATGTLWVVELDEEDAVDDRLFFVVCHREAAPACVRLPPQDMREGHEYSRWLDTLPIEVRRLAASSGARPGDVLPTAAKPSANP